MTSIRLLTRFSSAVGPVSAQIINPMKRCSRCEHLETTDEPLPPSGVCFDCQDQDGIL